MEGAQHRPPRAWWRPLGLLSYLRSGDFASAVFENWESEFLQMAAYVILTAFLFQRGSAELRDPDGTEDAPSTPPPSSFATFLHAYSLGIALAGLFVASFVLHLWGSYRAAEAEAALHGRSPHSLIAHLGDMAFWFEVLPELAVRVPCHGGAGCPFHRSAVSRLAGVEARGREQLRNRALDVAAESTLRDEPLPPTATHLCVDMQRLFGPGTDWALPWMPRVLPRIVRLCELGPERTIFTRFIPARRPGEGQGTWRRYYRHWASMTLEAVGADMVELMPELARYVPPAETIDKPVYSPWWGPDLQQRLRARDCDTLVVSGGETDMCVLATVLGAVDLGYRTVLVQDAVCSSSDESHDSMLELFGNRYGQHVEVGTAAEVAELWRVER